MPELDIFNDDAFSTVSLTAAINDEETPQTPIAEAGLFEEKSSRTTGVSVERKANVLSLVPAGERGSASSGRERTKRRKVWFEAVHLPERGAVLADDVQNVRAFGSETELESVQTIVNEELNSMKSNLEATHEWQRLGAIRGEVLDADGDVLVDMFDKFDFTKQTHQLGLADNASKIRNTAVAAKRLTTKALKNPIVKGYFGFLGNDYFDAFVAHPDVERAYDRWQEGQFNRQDLRQGFTFAGVTWVNYDVEVGGTKFVADDAGLLLPIIPGMLQSIFCPADYMSTVNTNGLPFYANKKTIDMEKGLELEGQSNVVHLNKYPHGVIHLDG